MIAAFVNTLKIPELRSRILFTLGMIFIVRIGVAITLPGVNPDVLQNWLDDNLARGTHSSQGAMVMLLNMFSGGAITNCAIVALGIMPYISSSIMMQLLSAVVPSLQKISREENGRQKIGQYTRFLALGLCLLQGYLLAASLQDPHQDGLLAGLSGFIEKTGVPLVSNPGFGFIATAVLTMTAGTMLLMWLGEQITERGIGNGVSLIICVNIVSAIPGSFYQIWTQLIGGANASPANALKLVALLAMFVVIVAGVIALTEAIRKIPVQYAKRVIGRKVMGGQTQHLPLKVNYSGVMPIIFAQAIVTFPTMILSSLFSGSDKVKNWVNFISGGWPLYTLQVILIFFFSYFWVATMFKPTQIADDLQKAGGYIPGKQPGKPTAAFLDATMGRLTLAGAIFLSLLAVLPALIGYFMNLKDSSQATQIFGGTSLLILVGVVLDIMRQAETHLMQRHYDGFLRKGRIRGRNDRSYGGGNMASRTTIVWIWFGIASLTLIAITFAVAKGFIR